MRHFNRSPLRCDSHHKQRSEVMAELTAAVPLGYVGFIRGGYIFLRNSIVNHQDIPRLVIADDQLVSLDTCAHRPSELFLPTESPDTIALSCAFDGDTFAPLRKELFLTRRCNRHVLSSFHVPIIGWAGFNRRFRSVYNYTPGTKHEMFDTCTCLSMFGLPPDSSPPQLLWQHDLLTTSQP